MTPILYKQVGAQPPKVGSFGDAGIDLPVNARTAAGYLLIPPGGEYYFDTGIAFEIPLGWVGLVVPRSGWGCLEVTVKNTIGVIDSRFRKTVKVHIRNRSDKEITFSDEDYLVQMVIVPHYEVYGNIKRVSELSDTDRGEGFGSSDNR